MKSVFVSYVFEDKRFKDKIHDWAGDGKLGAVTVTGESKDVRQGGDSAIRNHLSPLLRGAAALLVLVGSDTHNHDWVQYEVAHAQSHHKKILVVRIPNTSGAAPPSVRKLDEIPFEPRAIREALES